MKVVCLTILLSLLACFSPARVLAAENLLGIHILSTSELREAKKLLKEQQGGFVTIPLSYDDLNHKERWQNFFREASDAGITPIVRLTTRFENGSWVVPDRSDIMKFASFLSSLNWHREDLILIIFNEPNHAKEWAGKIDPAGYAKISAFAADWFHTESKRYVILPAGMDLAASTGRETLEAFAFWKQALQEVPELLSKFDEWNSHSYPNPGFSSNPWRTQKDSLRGYQHELTFLSQYVDKDWKVYITETGWSQDAVRGRLLSRYYQVAYDNIWSSDSRILAVTPFLLQGAPGSFAHFSFLDAQGKPSAAYSTYQSLPSQKN